MVDATLQAGTDARRLARLSARMQFGWASAGSDAIAMMGSYLAADAVRAFALSTGGQSGAWLTPDWSVAVFVAAMVLGFYLFGLYEPEAYVSRPLHLWTLLRATLAAFVVSAVSVYLIRSDALDESRLVLILTFAVFAVFAAVLRLGVLDGIGAAWLRRNNPVALVVGDSETAQALAARLRHLRGFDRVEHVVPKPPSAGAKEALAAALDDNWLKDAGVVSVFVDAANMKPQASFEAATAAQALGAEVYVVSGLLKALQGNRLLSKLFDAPIMRLRGSIEHAKPYAAKRALDVAGSTALLLLFAPVIAAAGILIGLTSPGPVFYRQTRVGHRGVPFEFLKLRSMVVNGDEGIHAEYVRAFMNGTAEAVVAGPGGEAIFKKVDDPRITPIGRFVRKYSLDELPQFWNVLRGDMSLVGPRPPLPYEVNEYDDWDSLRLMVPCGITGLWQVDGRSRVSFDEMILQDLMYAQNMRLIVDVQLCLRTLPATLLGGGGG